MVRDEEISIEQHVNNIIMMSIDTNVEGDMMTCCASCGIAEADDVKLRTCTACKSVRYCGVKCQREHRSQHKKACRKRMAELRHEILFRQPESRHDGDCPICILPLPLDPQKSSLYTCCSKFVCNGCDFANQTHEFKGSLKHKCPFCRHPVPETEKEITTNIMNRLEANDLVAMGEMGIKRYHEGDYSGALEYLTKAAGMGDIRAHAQLSIMYREGEGVEKDKKKSMYHLEEAAIGGHPGARHNLGCHEGNKGRIERAMKHFIISANLGYDNAIEALRKEYSHGNISKEDLEAAHRAHQAAVDATKSPQREAAEEETTAAL